MQLDRENEKYKKKYRKIKRTIKDLLFENAALCDQVASTQERMLIVKEERNFLLKKVQQFETAAIKRSQDAEPSNINHLTLSDLLNQSNIISKKPAAKKKIIASDVAENSKPAAVKMRKPSTATSSVKTANIKRKKLTHQVPTDGSGRPVFPIHLDGDVVIHSLGEVSDRSNYFNEDCIFPIGFCSTRNYGSLKDPEQQSTYTCKILDGGIAPKFEIVSDVDPLSRIQSQSIDECHSQLLRQINLVLGTEVVNTKGRGADFFGLSHPTIHHLIQSLPGVRKCQGYVWTKFEVCRSADSSSLEQNEASLTFEGLNRSICFAKSHSEFMIKDEPMEENYGEDSVSTFRNLLLD